MTRTGLVHIYMGDGKGKTTAAAGLALRAAGSGFRVMFVQFLKGRPTGETGPLEKLGVKVVRSESVKKFIPEMSAAELEECRREQQACLEAARSGAGDYDLIVLDEALAAAETGMISEDELCAFITSRPRGLELVLTGRSASRRLLLAADYVSQIKCVKHPYDRGVGARRGIEF
jgi:cob(I)alamin adenosyltransferase